MCRAGPVYKRTTQESLFIAWCVRIYDNVLLCPFRLLSDLSELQYIMVLDWHINT